MASDLPTPKQAKKRKKREPFGAIRKLGSRQQASYPGPDGVRYNAKHTFDNLTDARAWLTRVRASINEGTWTVGEAQGEISAARSRGVTLGEYAVPWIATRTGRNGRKLAVRTLREYERLLRTELAPIATTRISVLTSAEIRKWYSDMLATGKLTQAARSYGLATSILATAVTDGLIRQNPCNIRGAQNASTGVDVTPPVAEQLGILLDTIAPNYHAAIMLGTWAACRYGEVTELRRKDIRILRNADGSVKTVFVFVSRGVTHTTEDGYVIGTTKSEAGIREIAMPPFANDVIVNHLRDNVASDPEALLYTNSTGTGHLPRSSFVDHWDPARIAAGRPDLHFHALRHYGATKFAQTGATLKEIQDRLGHSTVGAAMRYQHSTGRDEELAARMSELAGG
ncbi:tyrosine-type recombinase/integrase [Lacisediminihabitans sp. FW035]